MGFNSLSRGSLVVITIAVIGCGASSDPAFVDGSSGIDTAMAESGSPSDGSRSTDTSVDAAMGIDGMADAHRGFDASRDSATVSDAAVDAGVDLGIDGAQPVLSDPCAGGSGLQPGSPWPMQGRCPTHDGQSANLGPQAGTQKWIGNLDGTSRSSSPAIDRDGVIYIGGGQNVAAFDADGSRRWTFRVPIAGMPGESASFPSSPAIGIDGAIYIGCNDGDLYAINPNGRKRWVFSTGSGNLRSSPAIGRDGTIYLLASDALLYAIHPNGVLKWTFGVPSIWRLDGSPSLGDGDTVYYWSHSDLTLYAVAADGTRKWSAVVSDPFTAGVPAIGRSAAGEEVIYLSDGSQLLAFNADGIRLWSHQNRSFFLFSSSPAVGADGTIYIASEEGHLHAIGP